MSFKLQHFDSCRKNESLRKVSSLQILNLFFFACSDDDFVPYDMSFDVKKTKVKAPKYIRNCMEGKIILLADLHVSLVVVSFFLVFCQLFFLVLIC